MVLLFLIAMMVAAAVSGDLQNPKTDAAAAAARPALLKDNSNGVSDNHRKPKSRIVVVSSRYMSSPSPSSSTSTSNSSSVSSSSSSRRFPSPFASRNSPPVVSNRSVSVDRRRLAAVVRPLSADLDHCPKPGNAADVSAAAKLLVTSTRSLSVSFQGEAFLLPISKAKAAPSPPYSGRKATPERRRPGDHLENSKPGDRHRWPGRNRLAKSLDYSKANGSGNGIHVLRQSMVDERRTSVHGRAGHDSGNSVSDNPAPLDLTASDTDSVSSGSTAGVNNECRGAPSSNGILVSARFWQETNRRLRRLQDPGSPGSKVVAPPKLRRSTNDKSLSSALQPIHAAIRPASPGKVMTPPGLSPSRGHSPYRMRNVGSTLSNSVCETPSVLSYAVDVRRGKVGENRIIDAHLLRLLYNRHLQWRFMNARGDAALLVQKRRAEKNLWNAWITISNLRDCLTKKRHRLQLLRQKLKLASILKRQMSFLEDWASLDKDHLISLIGAIESLKASTLRLPVVGGAIANVQSVQDAIGSAVDVMQAMASSICLLLPLVEEANILATELAKVNTKERAMLEQCTDFISQLSALQVKGSSLRTHILQHNRARTSQQEVASPTDRIRQLTRY